MDRLIIYILLYVLICVLWRHVVPKGYEIVDGALSANTGYKSTIDNLIKVVLDRI